MLKIYGSILCKDCVQCRQDLDSKGVAYEYFDFAEALVNLKEFLSARDREAMFESVKADGRIGIPLIIREDGSMTFEWSEFCK